MKPILAIAIAIVIVAMNLAAIFFAWRGYKKQSEWFPLILAICALPVVAVLAGMIVYGNF